MELLDRLGQKIGESVGIYSRTADEDEVFVRHEKLADATRYVPALLLQRRCILQIPSAPFVVEALALAHGRALTLPCAARPAGMPRSSC